MNKNGLDPLPDTLQYFINHQAILFGHDGGTQFAVPTPQEVI